MRLKNRILKATIWTDGELIRWARDKRFFYISLWCMAEDSCCIEDDPFAWKVTAWASPTDSAMSVKKLTAWRDELIECGKLIPYEVAGRRYFYLPTMAQHERPRNPQSPDNPLPPWVTWRVKNESTGHGEYVHGDYCASNEPVMNALSCPVLSCTDLPGTEQGSTDLNDSPHVAEVRAAIADDLDEARRRRIAKEAVG